MGAALKYYTIDKALMDGEERPLGAYVAICHLLCDSLGAYQASFGPYAQEIRGDIPNFTDGTSIHQISEVVAENSAPGATKVQHRIRLDRGSSSHMSDQVSQ
jgi:uncharacterized protein (TIGR02118 family)